MVDPRQLYDVVFGDDVDAVVSESKGDRGILRDATGTIIHDVIMANLDLGLCVVFSLNKNGEPIMLGRSIATKVVRHLPPLRLDKE